MKCESCDPFQWAVVDLILNRKLFYELIRVRAGEDRKIWPHSFEFRLRVVLAPPVEILL